MRPGEFVAQWPGWCPGCDDAVREGDLCTHNALRQVIHVDCDSPTAPPRAPLAVCPRCHLTRPCEHDDGLLT